MKSYFKLTILITVLSLFSCNKDFDVTTPNLEITVEKTNYYVGDSVVFNFLGEANYVTFFSGEKGHIYEYRDRIVLTGGKPILQFSTSLENGYQKNSLRLLASTDFVGIIDSSLVNYNWTDITNRATLATGKDNTFSGGIDLSEFISEKNVSIAFEYSGLYNELLPQPTWTITNFEINYVQDSLNIYPVVPSIANAGFINFDLENPKVKWIQRTTSLKIGSTATKVDDNLDWIITKSFALNQILPDKGVGIMSLASKINNYVYVFQEAGIYDVVFICKNATIKESKLIEKHFQITVSTKEN